MKANQDIINLMNKLESEAKANAYDYNQNHFGRTTLNYEGLWNVLKDKLKNEKTKI